MSKHLIRQDVYALLYSCKYFSLVCMFGDDKSSRLANKYAVQNTWRVFNEQKVL